MTTTYYTISQFINGVHAFTSDVFKTREDAEDFLESYQTYDHSDVDYAVFKCKTKDEINRCNDCDEEFVVDEQEYEDYEMEEDLSTMTIEDYGKGYLLRPCDDDERFGEKYLLEGWWNKNANGWFFKKDYLHDLLLMGADFISDEVNDGYEETEVCGEFIDDDLSKMKYTRYGKGYLLVPKSDDDRFGIKYFLDGWWMPSQSGWFFKREYKQTLRDHGAKFRKNLLGSSEDFPESSSSSPQSTSSRKTRSSTSNDESFETHGAKFKKYGKGWLLVPKKSHPDYGEKYYHGGWWNSSQNAWFFRNSVKNSL